MYTSFYNLKVKPFQISSDPTFIWLGEKHKEALATLTYGVLDNKGFMLLTGDVGTGKTTLLNTLIKGLGSDILYASVPDPRLELNDFLNYIASAFNIRRGFKTKGKFLIYFKEFLLSAYENNKKVLLLIDEAQLLTQDMLEEIRLLSNIQKDGNNLLNIFFVGQDEFNEILDRPENRAVAQRLTLNYHLAPLSVQETASYIRHRLAVAGTTAQLFDPEAVREIHAYSGGFPRRINIICDHCLLTGYVQEQKVIDGEMVRICAHDLKIPQFTGRRIPPPRPIPPQTTAPAASPVPAPSPAAAPVPPVTHRHVPSRPLHRRRPNVLWTTVTAVFLIVATMVLFDVFAPETFISTYNGASQYLLSIKDKLIEQPLRQAEVGITPTPHGETRRPTEEHANTVVGPKGDITPKPRGKAKVEKSVAPQNTAESDQKTALTHQTKSGAVDRTAYQTAFMQAAPESAAHPARSSKPDLPRAEMLLPKETVIVRFGNNSSEFYFTDLERVDEFVNAIKNRPDVLVVISGHADSFGSEGYNYRLSLLRANMLKSFFLGRGIPAYQLKVRAFGSKKPLMSNETAEGRRMNRRVEIDVVQ